MRLASLMSWTIAAMVVKGQMMAAMALAAVAVAAKPSRRVRLYRSINLEKKINSMFWHDDVSTEAGRYRVLLSRGEFVDDARANEDGSVRSVSYKIYYPEGDDLAPASVPVVIWSHGFGGNKDGAAFIARYVASYGYALVHITHHGTDSSLWEGKEGHPWDHLRKAKIKRHTTLNRFRDVSFVLDSLANVPELAGIADLSRLGMSGHSFGAMTTQVMAGMLFPLDDGSLISLAEERFSAGLLYSPVPIAHLTDAPPQEVYSPVAMPLFHMTGTKDDSPIENFGYEQRLIVRDHSGCTENYLQVLEGGDHMVYNGTRGKLGINPLRAEHEDLIKTASLAYWDYYLKGDEAALEWLKEQGYGG